MTDIPSKNTASAPDIAGQEEERDLVSRMKQDILANRYKRGEWLRLADLEKRYEASRGDVRKALAALATLRALEHVENYGYRVVVINEEQDRQNREVRYVLEVAAARWIMERATPAELEQAKALAVQFEWNIENADLSEVDLSNHEFHRYLASLCGNPAMAELINNLRELLMPARRTPWHTVSGLRRSAAEHFIMVDAIANKDIARFEEILKGHIFRWITDQS